MLHQYLRMLGHTTGALFRNISGVGEHARTNLNPVSYSTFSALVKHWAGELGFDAREFASHPMRHGCADDLKLAGVSTAVGMAVTNHASASAYTRYGGAAARRRRAAAQRRGAVEARAAAAAAAATSRLSTVWSAGAPARQPSGRLAPCLFDWFWSPLVSISAETSFPDLTRGEPWPRGEHLFATA